MYCSAWLLRACRSWRASCPCFTEEGVLQVLFHLHMWQSYVQGNPMWRICDTAWGDKIAHNHGAPPEGLWKLVAVGTNWRLRYIALR